METEEQMRAAIGVVADFRRKFEERRLDALRRQFEVGGADALGKTVGGFDRAAQIYDGVFDAFEDVVAGYDRAVKRLRFLQEALVARLYLYYPKAKGVGK